MVRTRPHGAPPTEFVKNKRKWTQRWSQIVERMESHEWATPKAKRILKKALTRLTHGKCAYCETRLDVSDHATIDHYVAKTIDTSAAFEWTNLLPACPLCNRTKSNEDHGGQLIGPHREDPEDYFWVTPEGKLEPHPQLDDQPAQRSRCEESIRICGLNRGALCDNRYEVMKDLQQLLHQARATSLAAVVEPHLDPHRPYKLVIRRVLQQWELEDVADDDRRRFMA